MKVRYRNVTSREIRDVESGSDEESQLKGGVYTAGGLSRPMWLDEDDYQAKIEADELDAVTQAPETLLFGNHQRRLTPGEVAMGIKTYEHKLANLASVDDEEEEEDDDEPLSSQAPLRSSKRRSSGAKGLTGSGAQTGSQSRSGGSK